MSVKHNANLTRGFNFCTGDTIYMMYDPNKKSLKFSKNDKGDLAVFSGI